MDIKTSDFEFQGISLPDATIVLLPNNLSGRMDDYYYSSTAMSFFKYAKDKISVKFLSSPEVLIEQRSGDWFAPLMIITQQAIIDHPLLTSILAGLFTNYLSDLFKGQPVPKANIDLIIETKKKVGADEQSRYVRFKVRCEAEDLTKVMETVRDIADGE